VKGLRRLVAAACLIGVAFAGGSAGVAPGPASIGSLGLAPAQTGALVLAGLFSPRQLASMSSAEIEEAAASLARRARDSGSERENLVRAFPRAQAVLSFLALDRDVDDFVEASTSSGAAGPYYRHSAVLAEELRPIRGAYETLYTTAHHSLAAEAAGGTPTKSPRPLTEKGFTIKPNAKQYRYSHPYALDVFFRESAVSKRGSVETGPRILSLSSGIVVAAAADWRGGGGIASWKGGGLSPAAGNGVVVYDPAARRYYSYFHLSEVSVLTGQAVEAGKPLGRGGNSGMNARKSGHGGHVHLEVFDAADARALRAEEIAAALAF